MIILLLFYLFCGCNATQLVLFGSSPSPSTKSQGNINVTPTPFPSPRARLDDFCLNTVKPISAPTLSCDSVFMLISASPTDQMKDLPTLKSFSPSDAVTGPIGTIISPSFSGMLVPTPTPTPTVVLSNTFVAAGVYTNGFVGWWSGSLKDGSIAPTNCNDWTSSTPSPSTGESGFTSLTTVWVESTTSGCNSLLQVVCGCLQYPTSSPTPATNSPTTKSPTTKLPTKSPTKSPTRSPTKYPTKSPTIPTKSPTRSPTRSPTKYPTKSPTKSPSIVRPGQIMYKLKKGSQVTLERTQGNGTTFSTLEGDSSQSNITIQIDSSNFLIPVVWTSITYREYNISTGITDTKTLSECNPANPPIYPGAIETFLDGYVSCPASNKCILTNDCTDDLTPDIFPEGGGIYVYNWPDLRVCVCTYTVTERIDVPQITNDQLQLSLVEGYFTPVDPTAATLSSTTFLGVIYCNQFIDRQLNCQLKQLVPSYIPQCASEPITCFSDTLGYAFGGFWNQNPNFTYTQPREEWTFQHYYGISSTMNFKLYSKNGQYIDPFTSKIWVDYLWIDNIADLLPQTLEVFSANYTMQVDLLQGRNYMFQQKGLPLPSIVYSQEVFTADEATCIKNSLQYNTIQYQCDDITWAQETDSKFKYPAFSEFISIPDTQNVLTLNVTLSSSSPYVFTQVQVFNLYGELCGTYLSPPLDTPLVFVCLDLPTTESIDGFLEVRYYGITTIMDIPQQNLNPEYIGFQSDPLYTKIVPSTQLSPNYLSFNLMYAYLTGNLDVPLTPVDGSITTPLLNLYPTRKVGTFTETFSSMSTYYINYTDSSAGSRVAAAWNALSQSILNNNTYPFNYALQQQVNPLYTPQDVNFTSEKDLDYLYSVWETWLAPRRCGADSTQCQTFNLGNCIMQQDDVNDNRWRQNDPGADYDFFGDEGGCDCYNIYERGFYHFQLFCSQCKQGYGPLSLDTWGVNIQYNNLIKPIFDSEQFPFNQFTLSTQAPTTRYPTGAPTNHPTIKPTSKPTTATSNPTKSPTQSPIPGTHSPTTPTGQPTKLPSKSPTKNPTRSPTKSPTNSPTNLTKRIVLYSDSIPSRGSISNTTDYCESIRLSQNLNCNSPSLWANTGTTAQQLTIATKYLAYNFALDTGVYGPTGILISTSWNNLGRSQASSFANAGVMTINPFFPNYYIWTGAYTYGTPGGSTCNFWTSSAWNIYGNLGLSSSTTENAIYSTNARCDQPNALFVCMCIQGSDTPSPTTVTSSPTKPTKKPTSGTSSPTKPTSNPTVSPSTPPTLPTKSPTRNPTKRPTRSTYSPTLNPVTRSPTGPTLSPLTSSPTTNSPTTPTNTPTTGTPTTPTSAPTTGTPTSQPLFINNDVQLFEQLLSCRLPVGPNPILSSLGAINDLICAGQGQVELYNNQTVDYEFNLYENKEFPLYTSIFLTYTTSEEVQVEEEFILNITLSTGSIYSVPYVSSDGNILNLINQQTFYLNNIPLQELSDGTFKEDLGGGRVFTIDGINSLLITIDSETFYLNNILKKLKIIKTYFGVFV